MRNIHIDFGTVKIPVDKQHEQTGIYSSKDWRIIRSKTIIRLYSPSHGDPLFEEVKSKSYSFKLEQKL